MMNVDEAKTAVEMMNDDARVTPRRRVVGARRRTMRARVVSRVRRRAVAAWTRVATREASTTTIRELVTTEAATVADVARVERVVRRVNRRIASAVEAFTSDDAARGRAEVASSRRGWGGAPGTAEASASGGVERAFVWFHGYGDVDGESWREFCDVVVAASGKTCAVVCPDAPRSADGARAWFKPRLRTRRPDERDWTCDGIEESVERVVRVVDDACERYGIESRANVVVGGFSQGACLALACAKSELSDVGGVLAVRGYLPDRSREFTDLKPNTLILAGGSDPMVPREWSFEAGRLTGGDVVLRERLGHELCVEDVYHARRWIAERFSGVL